MAERAYLIETNDDGTESRTIVYAKTLTERDRYRTYLCCGKTDSGEECLTNLQLCIFSDGNHRFSVKGKSRHSDTCNCDESRPDKVKRISRFDTVCKNETEDSIFERIIGKNCGTTRTTTGKKGPVTTEKSDPTSKEEDEGVFTSVEENLKTPSTAKDLYLVLSTRKPNMIFAGKQVGKWLISEQMDNISGYAENGLDKPAQMAMVVLTPMNPNDLPIKLPEGYCCFSCRTQDQEDVLFFLIPWDFKTTGLVFKKIKTTTGLLKFAVLARWKPYPAAPNTYYCSKLTSSQLTFDLD